MRTLLEKKTDIDPEDGYSLSSALGAAARHGHTDIIRLLLQKGWNANRKLKNGNSILGLAATYGHAEAVEALLKENLDRVSREKALEIASEKGKRMS